MSLRVSNLKYMYVHFILQSNKFSEWMLARGLTFSYFLACAISINHGTSSSYFDNFLSRLRVLIAATYCSCGIIVGLFCEIQSHTCLIS